MAAVVAVGCNTLPSAGGCFPGRMHKNHQAWLQASSMQPHFRRPLHQHWKQQHQQQGRSRLPNRQQSQRPPPVCPTAAVASAASPLGDDDERRLSSPAEQAVAGSRGASNIPSQLAGLPFLGPLLRALDAYLQRVSSLWRRFLPMLSLFFFLSFINTILDSLKDTLVITAAGGGTSVIPFLTVYAVLPCSLMFLVAYSWASQRMSRAALFNVIVTLFGAFFATFALFLMPNADALHLHAFADGLQQVLPAGLAGAIGMVRNWTYTLFFCASELWGDVCMGLLFWGLANDTTSLADAPTLYPLFGLGANVAQATAGVCLKSLTVARQAGPSNFCRDVQMTLSVVIGMAVLAMCLHYYIAVSQPRPQHQAILPPRPGSREAVLSSAAAAAARDHGSAQSLDLTIDMGGSGTSIEAHSEGEALVPGRLGSGKGASTSSSGVVSSSSSSSSSSIGRQVHIGSDVGSAGEQQQQEGMGAEPGRGSLMEGSPLATAGLASASTAPPQEHDVKPSLRESFMILANSLEIRCLAVMSLAQGLCTSLMEFAWKSHMRLLYPSPSDFTAFLGDVATWTGVVTASLMLASPILFDKLGWRGVASTTPQILLYGGSAFFGACIAYQHFFGSAGAAAMASNGAVPAAGAWLLSLLVLGGATLFVFSRAAKFSLFKPAEEMVYITLDERSRTSGKAAIDVVGSQTGKSGGSILQQLLLIMSAGAIHGPILLVLFGFYLAMLRGWKGAVRDLSSRRRYTLNSPIHTFEEDDEWPEASAGGVIVAAPPRPEDVEARLEAAALADRLRNLTRSNPDQ